MVCVPVILALGKLRHKDHHAFFFSWDYRVRPYLEKMEKKIKKQNVLQWSRKMCSENKAELRIICGDQAGVEIGKKHGIRGR